MTINRISILFRIWSHPLPLIHPSDVLTSFSLRCMIPSSRASSRKLLQVVNGCHTEHKTPAQIRNHSEILWPLRLAPFHKELFKLLQWSIHGDNLVCARLPPELNHCLTNRIALLDLAIFQ